MIYANDLIMHTVTVTEEHPLPLQYIDKLLEFFFNSFVNSKRFSNLFYFC